ncbi:MAG TPA: response regulator, partial [Candidatus Omnitrophota bacterium]|nr:response regulator [Candidatus Omnitrophota bacterium]
PKMQGSEVCKKLKLDPKFKDIPIIVFTASVTHINEKTGEMGADDYLLKPFEPSDLIFKIKRLVR